MTNSKRTVLIFWVDGVHWNWGGHRRCRRSPHRGSRLLWIHLAGRRGRHHCVFASAFVEGAEGATFAVMRLLILITLGFLGWFKIDGEQDLSRQPRSARSPFLPEFGLGLAWARYPVIAGFTVIPS